MSRAASQCDFCIRMKHRPSSILWKNDEVFDTHYCEAFPRKIPAEIFDNRFDHTKPYNGDRGILFEPCSDEDVKTQADLIEFEKKEDKK
jgi:hypothetical protein